jgi:hypothetical protein
LILSNNGQSRVFSASIKDRGAILPGGHLGQAYWYQSSTGKFVTSTFYRDQYPNWVTHWNQQGKAEQFKNTSWTLLENNDNYVFSVNDNRQVEYGYKHLGKSFPHNMNTKKDTDFYKALRFTPFGDQLTIDFVKTMIQHEKIGQTSATDILAISLSASDYIGHAYGPNSLEVEDNLLQLDRTLANLIQYIEQNVGLENTLLVLSSDHGVDAIPEYKHELGMEAGRHQPKEFLAAANLALQQHFDITENLVTDFWNPSAYLDLNAIANLKLDIEQVEDVLAQVLQNYPGIAQSYTRHDLLKGTVTSDPITAKVQRAFHPKRSGNVLIVQDKNWFLYPDYKEFAAMHGSPYKYDTHVPVIFAGNGLKPKSVYREVAPEDIASTLSLYLDINAPSGSTGNVLLEVMNSPQ